MAKAIPWLLIGLMATYGSSYIFQMFSDPTVKPSAATWLIFCVATAMSLGSYKKAGTGNKTTGALIVVDAIMTWIIFLSVVAHSGFALRFRQFEAWYLLGACSIAIFWAISRNHRAANLLVNGLITVGWLPTYHKTISDGNSEPFYPWYINLAAGACGLVLAILPNPAADKTDKLLSKVYAWRSFISIGLNILLMHIYS